ncbi:MAG: O-antigen ligase family protein, partial [Clostridiales bacterium]|nr:O-antigen ligase family protein [Clostridiales bacterium]
TLDNPNVLGEYLIFIIAIAGGMLYWMKKPLYKLAALGILGASALCMILTQSRGAWLGLLFAAAAFALMHDRRLIILGVIALAFMPVLLPESVLTRFLSIGNMTDSSTSYRVNIWLACLLMIKDVWMTGIGSGEPSFRYIYQEYSFNAVEAPHSHNLYLQVIIELGVFGLVILAAILLTAFKRFFVSYKLSKDAFIRAAAAALAAGLFGYLVQGMTDNVWYNNRIVTFFWLILAIAGALREAASE